MTARRLSVRAYDGTFELCVACTKAYPDWDNLGSTRALCEKCQRECRRLKDRSVFPEKKRAYRIVRQALKSGRLQRQPCEVCGSSDVQAHHDNHWKPLDVRWLCRSHHTMAHNKLPHEAREEMRRAHEEETKLVE